MKVHHYRCSDCGTIGKSTSSPPSDKLPFCYGRKEKNPRWWCSGKPSFSHTTEELPYDWMEQSITLDEVDQLVKKEEKPLDTNRND